MVLNKWEKYLNDLLNEGTEENTQQCKEIYMACQLINCPNKEQILQAELLKIHGEELIKRSHKIISGIWERNYHMHGRYNLPNQYTKRETSLTVLTIGEKHF